MHFVDKRGPGPAVLWAFQRHIVASARAMGSA
jgi:hypothetical protein